MDDESLILLKDEAEFYGLAGLSALCDNAGPKHVLIQGLSNTSYEAKVSYFVPKKVAAGILEKLKASQEWKDKGYEDRSRLFEWQIIDAPGTALVHIVKEDQALNLEDIPEDATEQDIMDYLKRGEFCTDFKRMYLIVSNQSHKRLYDGPYHCVVELSKPEHMELYERLNKFVDMELDGDFEEGRELLRPIPLRG